MSWPASIFSALLTGLLGMFLSGFIAAMAVDWYNIPGREGESGYFVVALGILGFGAGLIIGLLVARVGAGTSPSFLRVLGVSLAIVAGIGALGGGLARALADVPPKLNGEELLLAVEVRWPTGQKEAPVPRGADEPSVSLHSIPWFSHTVRASGSGPLWMEDAHLVDSRWVVPGAVNVFTSRGTRMLSVATGEQKTQGFQVPLGAFPGKQDLEWSDWLPRFRPGVTVPPDLLSYRYRVQKVTQPIRTETIGPFEVATTASVFYPDQQDRRTVYAAAASFGIRYRGQPLVIEGTTSPTGTATERFDRIDEVAVVPGATPALLIHVDPPSSAGYCYLITADGEKARIEYVAELSTGAKGQPLTTDTAVFRAASSRVAVRGRIDRIGYEHPGLYRLGSAVIDTRRLVVRQFTSDTAVRDEPSVAPLGISPDERSFVTYASTGGSAPAPLLLVTDFVAGRTYTLPIDPVRMRYPRPESLDPTWLEHHFEWQRGHDGVDQLAERRHFVPLPYRGEVSVDYNGGRTYRIERGTEGLRGALLDFLVREFQAERQPADSGAFEVPLTIAGQTLGVVYSPDSHYISLSMRPGGSQDTTLVPMIGQRFDAALATGRYDSLFTK